MKKTIASLSALLATAGAAFANPDGCAMFNNCRPVTDVPEISAMTGTAALATLAAIVLLTWERRRRAQ